MLRRPSMLMYLEQVEVNQPLAKRSLVLQNWPRCPRVLELYEVVAREAKVITRDVLERVIYPRALHLQDLVALVHLEVRRGRAVDRVEQAVRLVLPVLWRPCQLVTIVSGCA